MDILYFRFFILELLFLFVLFNFTVISHFFAKVLLFSFVRTYVQSFFGPPNSE